MSTLTTARLDEMAVEATRDFPVWVGEIIEAARESVARQECADEASRLSHIVDELRRFNEGWTASTTSTLMVGRYHYSGAGPTPTAAYLALRDALRSPNHIHNASEHAPSSEDESLKPMDGLGLGIIAKSLGIGG